MRSGLEKRLARLEKRVAERTEKTKVCNCRVWTRFHCSSCLYSVLKGTPRVCPVHGFRELGFFWWTPQKTTLRSEDHRFCPCPPHPWRSFQLSEGPHRTEARHAALEAETLIPPDLVLDLAEDNQRSRVTIDAYCDERRRWLAESGRRLPTRAELVKLLWQRAREYDGQTQRPSL